MLRETYDYWFHDILDDNWNRESYTYLGEIKHGEDFWKVAKACHHNYNGGMFFLMRRGIFPNWEDKENRYGGCWSIQIGKRHHQKIWEHVCVGFLANELLVGNQDNINGVSISPKIQTSIIKIWVKKKLIRFRFQKDIENDLLRAGVYLPGLKYSPHRK